MGQLEIAGSFHLQAMRILGYANFQKGQGVEGLRRMRISGSTLPLTGQGVGTVPLLPLGTLFLRLYANFRSIVASLGVKALQWLVLRRSTVLWVHTYA